MVKERQIYLNHPKLWRKVLEKYPRLRINFAHMGGNKQVALYANELDTGYWTKEILSLVYDYKNAYRITSYNVCYTKLLRAVAESEIKEMQQLYDIYSDLRSYYNKSISFFAYGKNYNDEIIRIMDEVKYA